MRWRDLGLKWKFTAGFGLVLALLLALGAWSVQGIGGIVGDAEEVIGGNRLRAEFVQKIVDHLNWANTVSSFLNDTQAAELKAQTDPRQCGFGQWYYSDERTEETLSRQGAALPAPPVFHLFARCCDTTVSQSCPAAGFVRSRDS
ncbi:MAG: CZB domain-containing protein [Desulfocurvibacter africanus]